MAPECSQELALPERERIETQQTHKRRSKVNMKLTHKRSSALRWFTLAALSNTILVHVFAIEYHVEVNTAALIGNPSGPFALDFQLNDGSGSGDGNNSVTLNNFAFGTGSPLGSPTFLGNASGDLSGGVTLRDTTPFNEFYQGFTTGTTLGFDLNLTLNPDAGGTPDAFSFAILFKNLSNLPTTGVGDTLLMINVTGAVPDIQFGESTNPGGVTASISRVPESFPCLGFPMTLVGLFFAKRRMRTP